MKYCSKCGHGVDDEAIICPNCGCAVGELPKEESGGFGIAAIVFGALGGWLGLVFGIIGLCTYKNAKNRRNCKIGMGLFFGWIVLWIIIFCLILI